MAKNDRLYYFYRPYIRKIIEVINRGKVLICVGINGIGKIFLAEQILSAKFKEEFIGAEKVHLTLIDLKDKAQITTNQLYSYWLNQTLNVLGLKTFKEEVNNYSFYTEMINLINKLSKDEKMCFIILDAQNMLACDDGFYQSLIYLQTYSYGKVSYILLSEPDILETKNTGMQRFLQRYESQYKFTFLKEHDVITMRQDIKLLERLFEIDLKKYQPILLRYSRGLYGLLRSFCQIIKEAPDIKNVRQLVKIAYANRLCWYWVNRVLDSLPRESVRILKDITVNKASFDLYKKSIYGQWLVDLTFIKPNGTFRYPLMLPMLKKYSLGEGKMNILRKVKGTFCVGSEKIRFTKQESCVLEVLYRNRGRLVSLEQVGNAMWNGNPDKYSLWGITQIIRHLRKTLSYHFINPQTIRSVRGKGYVLILN